MTCLLVHLNGLSVVAVYRYSESLFTLFLQCDTSVSQRHRISMKQFFPPHSALKRKNKMIRQLADHFCYIKVSRLFGGTLLSLSGIQF
jgi:hypothetical protein